MYDSMYTGRAELFDPNINLIIFYLVHPAVGYLTIVRFQSILIIFYLIHPAAGYMRMVQFKSILIIFYLVHPAVGFRRMMRFFRVSSPLPWQSCQRFSLLIQNLHD